MIFSYGWRTTRRPQRIIDGARDRARWFSWFVTGPAKLTWQRTLKQTDKTSWKNIVAIYKGQYGVHLDPRTAYQRCHELKYEQFGSAQGLLEAMRDYQQMAPTKLTDETLESILWNKAPVELQKEVGEIPDGVRSGTATEIIKGRGGGSRMQAKESVTYRDHVHIHM